MHLTDYVSFPSSEYVGAESLVVRMDLHIAFDCIALLGVRHPSFCKGEIARIKFKYCEYFFQRMKWAYTITCCVLSIMSRKMAAIVSSKATGLKIP